MQLIIYYDSQCPLCQAEMQQLKEFDSKNQISFADLHAPDFIKRYPHIDPVKANRILHGELASGELLLGLDVTCLAWSLVGKHKWLAVLRWPLFRYVADGIYLIFARYRNPISRLLMGKANCMTCQTRHKSKNFEHEDHLL